MKLRHIQSRDNAHYKQLRQWASSNQARRKAGMTVLDGVHLCQAWLQQYGAPAHCVAAESALTHPEVARVVAQCEPLTTDCTALPDTLFAPLEQVEQGVGLLFVVPVPTTPADLSSSCVIDGATLLLDGIQDPGNLGTILRTAAAAGMQQVFCSTGSAAVWSPKVLRAGMGAHFVLRIIEDANLAQLVLQSAVPVYATQPDATHSIYTTDLRAPCAWLFGHEGQGVSAPLLELASERLAIPHSTQVESLNVAASVAVCLFEQRRQQSLKPTPP